MRGEDGDGAEWTSTDGDTSVDLEPVAIDADVADDEGADAGSAEPVVEPDGLLGRRLIVIGIAVALVVPAVVGRIVIWRAWRLAILKLVPQSSLAAHW